MPLFSSKSPLQISPMLEDRFPLTCAVLAAGVAEGVAPGFVAGLWQLKYPDEMNIMAWGQRRVFPTPQPMLANTVFDLASLTKVFATAPLAAALVDRGWLSWDTPIAALLPDYPYPKIEVRHLLSHTAGLAAWAPFWKTLWEQFAPIPLWQVSVQDRQIAMKKLVFAVPPESPPGERCVYSDLSFLILGFALEELTHLPLDQAVRKWVWDPMGIRGAKYFHTNLDISRAMSQGIRLEYAATEDCSTRGGVLQGQVHDDNCWAMGGFAGHAGAFGQASDVLQYARGLFQGFLSPQTLQAMWTKVSKPLGCERTLGWDTPSANASSVGTKFSPASVGHLGFTGTSLWIDLEAELAVTLLSNRVHPSRENTHIKNFRPRFHDAIRLDLGR
ncbi:MAG: serine hydrolase domain-containing protein [Bdellovibrionia bacterium]